MNARRVVITGCGAVTPVGIGKEAFWDALAHGKNGVGPIASFDTSNHPVKIAAEVKDFNAEDWFDRKEARRTDRVIQFAAACTDMAIKDSGLDMDSVDKNMLGVYIGTGEGGIHTLEDNLHILNEKGPSRVSPFLVPMMIVNMPAAYVAIRIGAKGANMAVVTACASSINSMGEAACCISRGDADIILAGGSEAAVSPLAAAGFSALKALSTRYDDPEHASRPFDAERDGFVMGEGAAIFVFEEYQHARARGAHIYAEVTGYGLSCDAHHITAPDADGDGAYRAMAMAVRKAGWKKEDIDLINAHGTSTPLNDKMETAAIRHLLGEDLSEKTLVHSTKSMIGHTLGAAGAIETAATILAIERGIVHPTINYSKPDPECRLNIVAGNAVKKDVRRALINNFGFGGHNGVLAIEACRD